jgi:hypothetical protein
VRVGRNAVGREGLAARRSTVTGDGRAARSAGLTPVRLTSVRLTPADLIPVCLAVIGPSPARLALAGLTPPHLTQAGLSPAGLTPVYARPPVPRIALPCVLGHPLAPPCAGPTPLFPGDQSARGL